VRPRVRGRGASGAKDLADVRATLREAPGADPAAMAALLRSAFRRVERPATELNPPGQSGHLGSTAGTRPIRALAGPERDQTGKSVAVRDSDSHGHLGSEPARIFGGRQRGPLRDEPGRKFHLESDLHRYFKRLDRRRGGVESRRHGRIDGHARGGGAFAFRLAGVRLGQRRRAVGLSGVKTKR
jgi:hypothetical protein